MAILSTIWDERLQFPTTTTNNRTTAQPGFTYVYDDQGTNHRTYNSFGKLTAETNAAVDLIFGYTGKQLDDATELQHNLFRWYDSSLGQWLSEDPLGFAAGDENLKRYVGNGVSNLIDPSGLWENQNPSTPAYMQGYSSWLLAITRISMHGSNLGMMNSISQSFMREVSTLR